MTILVSISWNKCHSGRNYVHYCTNMETKWIKFKIISEDHRNDKKKQTEERSFQLKFFPSVYPYIIEVNACLSRKVKYA